MYETNLRRRRLLQAGGATLAVAVAGCTGDLPGMGGDDDENGGGGGPPAYADWVGTMEEDGKEGAIVGYVDLAALAELEDDEDDENGEDDGDDLTDIEDPLIGIPVTGAFVALLGAGWALMEPGLGDLVDVDADGGYETSIDDLILANESFVLTGSVDTEEIDAELTAEPEDELFGTRFERTDEVSGYDVYQPVQDDGFGDEFDDEFDEIGGDADDEEVTTIAVGDGAIVVGDGLERVEETVETGTGDGIRAIDEFDGFRRLLETAGHGHMVLAGYSPDGLDEESEESAEDDPIDPDEEEDDWFEAVDGANGYAGSIRISETEGEAKLAIDFEELSEEDREELEESLGSEAMGEATIDVNGGFVTASATYAEEDVEDLEDGGEF